VNWMWICTSVIVIVCAGLVCARMLRVVQDLTSKLYMLEGRQQEIASQSQQSLTEEHRQRTEVEHRNVQLEEQMQQIARSLHTLTRDHEAEHVLATRVEHVLKLFSTPQTAGIQFGESQLELILKTHLGDSMYERKPRYSHGGNDNVDFALKLPKMIVPIDSKFPSEAYRHWVESVEQHAPDATQKGYWREFRTAMIKKLEETAKYICPGEGTTDYALMFVPSDAIFQQAFSLERIYDEPNTIPARGQELRVFGCSPQTIMPILSLLCLGFQQIRLAEGAASVHRQVQELHTTFRQFERDWDRLNTHVKNAHNAMSACKSLNRLDTAIDQLRNTGSGGKEALSTAEASQAPAMTEPPVESVSQGAIS
jgi:DNA recombination protein RmuC